eukprot:614025-Rhodomonas_salina.3
MVQTTSQMCPSIHLVAKKGTFWSSLLRVLDLIKFNTHFNTRSCRVPHLQNRWLTMLPAVAGQIPDLIADSACPQFTTEMEDLLESTLSAAKDLMKGLQVYNKDKDGVQQLGNGWKILDEIEDDKEEEEAEKEGTNSIVKKEMREPDKQGIEPMHPQVNGTRRITPRRTEIVEGKSEQAGSNPKMQKDAYAWTEEPIMEVGTSRDMGDVEDGEDDNEDDIPHVRNIRSATESLKLRNGKWTDGIFSPRTAARPADTNPWIDPIPSPPDTSCVKVDASPGAVLRRTAGLSPEEALHKYGPPQEFSHRKRDNSAGTEVSWSSPTLQHSIAELSESGNLTPLRPHALGEVASSTACSPFAFRWHELTQIVPRRAAKSCPDMECAASRSAESG